MKTLKILMTTASIFLLNQFSVLAQGVINPIPKFNIADLFKEVVAILPYITIFGIIGAVITVGYTLIFSWAQGSNAEPVKKVRQVAMYALIGFSILIFAPFIIGLLLSFLGVEGLGGLFNFIP
jgi:hypothetical protein